MFDIHATEEEDKLVLMSGLMRIGPCSEEQLLRYVVEEQLMNQFQFYLALPELMEAGFVTRVQRLEGLLLELTEEGKQGVAMFESRIRASLMEKIVETGGKWRRRVREELQMPAQWVYENGQYQVTLRALENGAEFFHMTLTAATKAQAKRFCERWPGCAPELYQHAMQLLGETQQQAEPNTENNE